MSQDDPLDRTWPLYRGLLERGELEDRARQARARLSSCDLCARYCQVDRLAGERGAVCRTGEHAVVDSYGPHLGEENPLRGVRGSGTIFFGRCNLRCVYCQNWSISQKQVGREATADELAGIMLRLQDLGCHNINLVSPSHVVAQALAAVAIAAPRGLRLPLVYNTGGYDSPEALALLDGVVDIYMPDMKYGDEAAGKHGSGVADYVDVNRSAVAEMHRQVGDLELDDEGIARRGLLIRHLVLPGGMAGTDQVLGFIARELSVDSYVNLMDQYRPCYRADQVRPFDQALAPSDYARALELADEHGLHRLDRRRARW